QHTRWGGAHDRRRTVGLVCLANIPSGEKHGRCHRFSHCYPAMRRLAPTVTAIRFALSTRRDLLLEVLALHHQFAVLARSNRRFRPSDRLLWLILRPRITVATAQACEG